ETRRHLAHQAGNAILHLTLDEIRHPGPGEITVLRLWRKDDAAHVGHAAGLLGVRRDGHRRHVPAQPLGTVVPAKKPIALVLHSGEAIDQHVGTVWLALIALVDPVTRRR